MDSIALDVLAERFEDVVNRAAGEAFLIVVKLESVDKVVFRQKESL